MDGELTVGNQIEKLERTGDVELLFKSRCSASYGQLHLATDPMGMQVPSSPRTGQIWTIVIKLAPVWTGHLKD